MKRFVLPLLAASASIVPTVCAGDGLPAAAKEALRGAEDFELLSLDPDREAEKPAGKGFRGWKVLGRTRVKEPDTRMKLVAEFEQGIAEHDGSVAACFNPRHGIKVTQEGKTYDFVICFECYQVYWWVDGKEQKGILIAESPQPAFDKVLKDAAIPLPEK